MANCGYYGFLYKLTSGPDGTGETLGYTEPEIEFFENPPQSLTTTPYQGGSKVLLVISGPTAARGSSKTKNIYGDGQDSCLEDGPVDSGSASISESESESSSDSESESESYSYSASSMSGSGSFSIPVECNCGLDAAPISVIGNTLTFSVTATQTCDVLITNFSSDSVSPSEFPDALPFLVESGTSSMFTYVREPSPCGDYITVLGICTSGAPAEAGFLVDDSVCS